MTDDTLPFRLPADFVSERVRLRPAELAYGLINGWLDDETAVVIAAQLVADDQQVPAALVELAGLYREESWRACEVVEGIAGDPASEPWRVWLYLALSWLHGHRDDHVDPFGVIEMLYADFDYPTEIESLVRFLPVPEGAPTGPQAMESRWSEYLDARDAEFKGVASAAPAGDVGFGIADGTQPDNTADGRR